MQIKKQLITLGLSALLAQGFLPASLSAQQTKTEKVPGISLSDMDRKVRPQDNFYRYSNGGWIRKNPLKPAYSRFGTFDILRDTATSQIRHIVEELIAKPQTKGTNDYRVAVLYKQSLDSAERNRQGYKPLIPELQALQGIQTKEDLLKHIAQQDQVYGQGCLFGTGVAADEKNSTMNIFLFTQTSLGLGSRATTSSLPPKPSRSSLATKPTLSASSNSRATPMPKPAASPRLPFVSRRSWLSSLTPIRSCVTHRRTTTS